MSSFPWSSGPESADDPPQVGMGLLKRAALACIVIIACCGAAAVVASFLFVDDFTDRIRDANIHGGGTVLPDDSITPAEAGGPRTIMILGSDKRYGDRAKGIKARSDTILLVRIDPKKQSIAMMSIPRDLKVTIPGTSLPDKINAAFELGGPNKTAETVKSLFDRPGEPFDINHILAINFSGFQRAINYVHCVYVDIDRRYYNAHTGPGGYAAIDIQPGYQKLCGGDSLDYVRYRHDDTDLVRAARQQDFLRQLKANKNVKTFLSLSHKNEVATLFGRYVDFDKHLLDRQEVFSLLKLVIYAAGKPVRQVKFRYAPINDPVYINATQSDLDATLDDFMHGKQEAPKAPAKKSSDSKKKKAKKPKSTKPAAVAGLFDASSAGQDQGLQPAAKLNLPVYYPKLLTVGARYQGATARQYVIHDDKGAPHEAYRMVIAKGLIGQYYGVQGTSWRTPPILDNPSEVRSVGGKKLMLFYDGRKLRLVGWRTKNGAYWITNTLLESIKNPQMIAMAAALTRLG